MQSSSRRKFIGNAGKAAIAGTIIFAAGPQPAATNMKNIFLHHVYFWLKNAGSAADRDKLVEGLQTLTAIKTIRQFHIGKPAATNRGVIDTSYAVSWFVLFDNDADQASYQTDPIHLKFVEDYAHLWEKVIVYDSVDV